MNEKIKKILTVVKQTIKRMFTGRLDRKNWIIAMIILIVAVPVISSTLLIVSSPITLIVISLLLLIIELFVFSLHVRRFHDLGKSSSWIIALTLSGGLAIILLFFKGQQQENKYGPVPQKGIKFIDAVLNRQF